jgi:beta-phosphoglucomutase-like phosphatase (HAD superfamily)
MIPALRDVDAVVFGKPDPALFLEAARRLGIPARRTAIAEDALAGVEAGRRGGFGLVIGVDRTAGPDSGPALLRHGADVVVRDLVDLLDGEADGPLTGASRPACDHQRAAGTAIRQSADLLQGQ